MVEVELRYGQQNSGERQIWAEPTEERLDAREGSVDQRWVFYTHTVQYTHSLHQALKEVTGVSGNKNGVFSYLLPKFTFFLCLLSDHANVVFIRILF